MAIDIYMKFSDPNLAGDSRAKGHEKEFELFTLSYGAVATVPTGGGGSGAGKSTFSPVTVTLAAYNGPRLLSVLDKGSAFEVVFKSYRPDDKSGAPVVFETITLSEARITRFQEAMSSGEDRPSLELAFAYRRIQYVQSGISFTFTREQ